MRRKLALSLFCMLFLSWLTNSTAQVVNAQSFDWIKTFDFTISDYSSDGWQIYNDGYPADGFWQSGLGWTVSPSDVALTLQNRGVLDHRIDYMTVYGTNCGGGNWFAQIKRGYIIADQDGAFPYNIVVNSTVDAQVIKIVQSTATCTPHVSEVTVTGYGSCPFAACDVFATPTPVPPTETPSPTPIGLNPAYGYNNLCPDEVLNPEELSGSYIAACSHCIHHDGVQEIEPTLTVEWDGTPTTPTATPVYYYDDVATAAPTASPTAQNPTSVPSGTTFYYEFSQSSGDMIALAGNWQSAGAYDELHHEDVTLADNNDYRMISFKIAMPRVNNEPVFIESVQVGATVVTSMSSGQVNMYYKTMDSTGSVLYENWLFNTDIFNGNPQGVFITDFPVHQPSNIEIGIVSDIQPSPASLSGSVLAASVNLVYHTDWLEDSGGASIWDSLGGDVVCYQPENYGHSGLDELFSFDLLTVPDIPECYRVFPYIDVSNFVSSLGFSSSSSLTIPALDMCVYWIQFVDFTIFGIRLPITLLISGYAMIFLLRLIWRV